MMVKPVGYGQWWLIMSLVMVDGEHPNKDTCQYTDIHHGYNITVVRASLLTKRHMDVNRKVQPPAKEVQAQYHQMMLGLQRTTCSANVVYVHSCLTWVFLKIGKPSKIAGLLSTINCECWMIWGSPTLRNTHPHGYKHKIDIIFCRDANYKTHSFVGRH